VDLAERPFASTAGVGAVAILAFASKLVHLPMRLVAAPLASVSFPRFVKSLRHAGAPVREAGETAGWIVRLLALAAAASAGAAGPVAALTFGRGRFDAASLALLGKALLLLTPSIVAIGLVEVAAKYLLAAKRAKAVLAAQVAGLFAYLAAAPLLTRFGVGGLAIARDLSWGVAAFGLVLPLVTKERVLSARDLVTSALLACLAAPLAHAAASAVSVRPLARAAAAALVALAVFAASLPFVARRRP
jgi:putative peptidoglycan lipid II flippase